MSLDVRFHHDFRKYFLYLPAGTHEDGSSLWQATPLTKAEAILWEQGHEEMLAQRLRERGIALTLPTQESWLRRLWRWLLSS